MDTTDASVYILLSNIYATAGRWDDQKYVMQFMHNNGIKKIPGMTWVEIDGERHHFCAEDKDHPEAERIWSSWRTIWNDMKNAGFKPDTTWVTQNVSKIFQCSTLSPDSQRQSHQDVN